MVSKPSVAVIAACPLPFPRGTPVRIHRSSEALAAAGARVHVMTYHLGEELTKPAYRLSRISPVVTYQRLKPGPSCQKLLVVDPLLAVLVRRILKEERFDIIHAHHYEGLAIALAARTNQPVVYDAHTMLEGELGYYPIGALRGTFRHIGKRLDRWLPKKASHVIAVTEKIRHKLIGDAQIAAKDVTVIPNGVTMEPFLDIDRQAKSSTPTIVFAGNLAGYQGIELLLHALRQVLDDRPDARLLVISISSFAPYEELAKSLGIRDRIDLINAEFAELPALLARANVAVSPRTECPGLPQKLLNYMAAELPTVSFRGSAATLEHGVTGLLVENGNVPEFASSICRLLTDETEAQRLGQAARNVAQSTFSWEAGANKIFDVYEQVLSSRQSSRQA